MNRWCTSEIVEEAVRRLRPLHVVLTCAVSVLCLLVVLAAAADLQRAADIVSARDRAGFAVWVVTVPETETLHAADCAAMAATADVAAAGAVFGENLDLAAAWLPTGLAVSVTDISPGGLAVWTGAHAPSGVFVGDELAAASGLFPGASLSTSDGIMTVGNRLDPAVVPGSLRSSVVRVVPPTGIGRECWFRLAPVASAAVADLVAVAFPDNRPIVVRYADVDALSADPVALLSLSPLRHAWIVAAAVALLLICLLGVSSRTEVGIYRATGSRRRDLAAMATVQVVLVVLTGAPIGMVLAALGVLVWGTPLTGADAVWFVTQPAITTALFLLALGPLVLVLASSGRVVDALRG